MKYFYLAAALTIAGCKGSQVATQEPAAPAHQHTVSHTPDTGTPPAPGLSNYTKQIAAADKPGILSGIGKIFSTPEGRARRQARKDAAATVPRKLGKGAVWAPAAKGVQYVWKPDAPVALASDSATAEAADNTKAGQRGGAAATAPGATATTTTKRGISYWWLALVGAVALAYAYRKRILPSVFA